MGQDAEAEDDNHCQALEATKKRDPEVAHGIQANLRGTEKTQQQSVFVLYVTAKNNRL